MKRALLWALCLTMLLTACGKTEAPAALPQVPAFSAGALNLPEKKPHKTGEFISPTDPRFFPHFTPFEDVVSPDYREMDEDALWMEYLVTRDLRDFLAEELPDRVVDDFDRQEDGSWLVFGWQLEGVGELRPFVMRAWVTPLTPAPELVEEGERWSTMEFSLERWDEIPMDEVWSAVARYRLLVSEFAGGAWAILQTLGFDDPEFHRTGPWPRTEDGFYPTDLSYEEVRQAFDKSIAFSRFETAGTAGLFTQREGKLWYVDFGASGFNYWPDRVEQQEDGSWLSFEHYYDFLRRRHEYVVRVELETLEDGALRVALWDPDNEDLMESYSPDSRD